jgi:hypothetical protein
MNLSYGQTLQRGRYEASPDDVEAFFSKAKSAKKKAKRSPAIEDAQCNILIDDPKSASFITLFRTVPEWESIHTVYVQHLGAEASHGEQLKTCKKEIGEAFEQYKVCLARWFAHSQRLVSAKPS